MSAHHGYEPRHHAAAERGGLMAERADLDAVEAPTDSESGDAQYNADIWELRARITALVAEVKPAREVVDAARAAGHDAPLGYYHDPECGTCRALTAYDQAIGQPATADQPPGAR